MAKEKSTELKVGLLVLASIGILAVFILILGGVNFEKTYTVYVDFDNPGGLQSGAPVRIAGAKIGKVDLLEFRGGVIEPSTQKRSLVRAKVQLEERIKNAIHQDAEFYVTTQGVLGEQYLAIEPGTAAKPPLAPDSVVRGIDPPRLDLFLAKAYELLDVTVSGIRNNRELLAELATNTAALLHGLNATLNDNRDRINRTVANVEALSAEAASLTRDARQRYIDNPKLIRTVDNIDKLASQVQKDTEPMLKDAREALANVNRLSNTVGTPEEQAKIRKAMTDIAELASSANAAARDAQALIARVKKGEGNVGALLMDEELYDNVQEMVRDLKHNPWKFLWKE